MPKNKEKNKSEIAAIQASHEMELIKLQKALVKTIDLINKNINATEVEWLQLVNLSEEMKSNSDVAKECSVKKMTVNVEDQEEINKRDLNLFLQSECMQNKSCDEEFDSD